MKIIHSGKLGKKFPIRLRETSFSKLKLWTLVASWVLVLIPSSALFPNYGLGLTSANAATDTTRPTVLIDQPNEGSVLPPGNVIAIGRASDNPTGSGIKIVEVRVDGSTYKSATPASNGNWSTWSISLNIASIGSHRIQARATDNAGNKDWERVSIEIRTPPVIDTTIPDISITSPSNGTTIEILASGDPLSITGSSSDGGSGVTAVDIRLVDNAYVPTTPKAPGDWSTWSAVFSITPGVHRFIARATDNAGNQEWANLDITVVEATDAVAPSVSAAPAGGTYTSAQSIVLVASEPSVIYYTTDGNTPTIASSVYSSEISISSNTTLQYFAVDIAGNTGSVSTQLYTIQIPEPVPGGDLDQFGIAKLYPTAAGDGNEYYTKTNAATVTEFRDGGRVDRLPSGFSKNPDGSWNIPSSSTPRWVINGGWRNMEMTMQLKINSGTLVQLYSNGEQHTTTVTGAWHGSANKMRTYADGRMGFIKELYHESGNSGYTSERATMNSGTSITGKWVTVKFVGYNINNDSQRKLEAYVSLNNDNHFVKVAEYIDGGSWNASTRFDSFMANMRQNYPAYVPENRDTGQEIKRNEVITWQGDWVSFRSDGADYDFKNVSVREIVAGSSPNTQFIASTASLTPIAQAYVEPAHHTD